jgi:tetrapyrrole methylase family protein/MazG family protein
MERLKNLWNIVKKLRGVNGCPWDKEQDHYTLLPYLIEEVYEIANALEKRDKQELAEELGDLLFMVFSYISVAEEKNQFTLDDVIRKTSKKMIKRHPHVFSNKKLKTSQQVLEHWHQLKEKIRKDKNSSILDEIPTKISSLARAKLIQERVSRVGFDWENAKQAFEKIKEEINELNEIIKKKRKNKTKLEEEIGDLLFAIVNVARLSNIDSEIALRKTNEKFIKRFKYIEKKLREKNKSLYQTSLEEMEKLWQESKLANS